MIAGLGSTELLILLAVVVLLFGARKLPELARGTGQALRILREETRDVATDGSAVASSPEVAGDADPDGNRGLGARGTAA